MRICIFEDKNYQNLLPLCYARPVYELKTGAFTVLERILNIYPKAKFSLHCRPYLADTLRQRYGDLSINKLINDDYLFINGRLIPDKKFASQVKEKGPDNCWVKSGQIIAARVDKKTIKRIDLKQNIEEQLRNLPKKKITVKTIDYLWDLILYHKELLTEDINSLIKGKTLATRYREGVYIINSKKVFIDRNCQISPGVVIDASNGPIYLEENVTVGANSVLKGPVYIGYDSIINPLSRIEENTYIGPVCKIGGEVFCSIIQSYSSKQHEGHLGSSYIGSWCNLGADTTNSNMKNNYSSVKIWTNGHLLDSKQVFLGMFMADHNKSGIGTLYNTGTVVGFSTNVFGGKLTPKAIPSFGWIDLNGNSEEYNLNKAIATAYAAMKRRGVEITPTVRKLFKDIHRLSQSERKNLINGINKE